LQLNVFDSSDAPPGFRSRIAKFQWTVHVPLSAFPKGCRRSPIADRRSPIADRRSPIADRRSRLAGLAGLAGVTSAAVHPAAAATLAMRSRPSITIDHKQRPQL